jgi:uncharacterized protein
MDTMKIVIAGGTGFIGQAMIQRYLLAHHDIIVIGRNQAKIRATFDQKVTAITWKTLKDRAQDIENADVIINLSGAGIGDARWTAERKAEILNSRINPTSALVELCSQWGHNSPPLFNASAVGVYGLEPNSEHGLPPAMDEETPLDFNAHVEDFLDFVGRQWEMTTWPAREAGVRVVNMRFGVVLGKNGGVLSKLKLPFLIGLGGKLGTGKQAFSWVALPDLLRAIDFLLAHPDISGPVNIVAPGCVTQEQFAHALAKTLHRPAVISTPKFMLELAFGQMAEELLLGGQHVVPTRLQKQGFKFEYPDIKSALHASC